MLFRSLLLFEELQRDPEEEQDDVEEEQDDFEQQLWMDVSDDWQEGDEARDDDTAMQVPEPEGRIRIELRPEPEEENVFASSQTRHEVRQTTAIDAGERIHDRFNELLDARPPETQPPESQKVADRVAYLFPRPEPTEWDVRELSYDRRRRAEPETERRVS